MGVDRCHVPHDLNFRPDWEHDRIHGPSTKDDEELSLQPNVDGLDNIGQLISYF